MGTYALFRHPITNSTKLLPQTASLLFIGVDIVPLLCLTP